MKVDFLDPAEAEFVEAIAYYNLQSEGLGYEFAAEVGVQWAESFNTPMLGRRCPHERAVAARTDFLVH